jgi:uncharacterized BrkB/YihY/UPF0761 family membrane protein
MVVVVAFWIYYSAVVFILGAEIGQLYRERLTVKSGRGNGKLRGLFSVSI